MAVLTGQRAAGAESAARGATTAQPLVEASSAERAAELSQKGNQAMLDMRYVDALALYEQARSLEPGNVGIEYSLARAHQLLGDFPEALLALERFEQRATPEVKAKVGRLDVLFADLRSRVSTLHLKCSQSGARVLFRDKVVGVTPLAPAVRLPAGAGVLHVELEGFFPAAREVVLPGGGAFELELELHARSHSTLLHVASRPTGARIAVDGHAVGTASPRVELVLPSGTHRVSATREGYDSASLPLVLPAGATRDVTVALEPTVPITRRWWFWTAAAVVAAGGAALTVALLSERSPDQGSLPPGQVRAPLTIGF